jgi:hypothetical protein
MRAQGFIVFSLIAAVWAARADEKLPVLKAGSQVYSNVTVTPRSRPRTSTSLTPGEWPM